MITWRLPQRIDPLMSSGRVQLLEVYLGINGQTLDPTQMPAKLSTDDSYIIVQLPVGADGGYFKVKGSCFYKKSRFVKYILINGFLGLLRWQSSKSHFSL